MIYAARGAHNLSAAELAAPSEPLRSSLAARRAIEIIAADPFSYLRGRAVSLVHALAVEEYTPGKMLHFIPPVRWAADTVLLLQISYCLSALSGPIGLRALRRTAAGPFVAAVLIACFAQLALFNLPFEMGERHREFMHPLILLLCCIGFTTMVDRWTPVARSGPG
jgi:hypothetical protein